MTVSGFRKYFTIKKYRAPALFTSSSCADPSGYYMEGFKSKLMATLRNLFDGSCAFKIHWLSAGRQYPPGPPLRTEAPPNIHD